jgi:hypothetical protein
VVKAVLKWSWIIVILAVGGFVYGVLQTAKFTPQYTAKMTIASQKSPGALESGSTGGIGSGVLTSKLVAVLGASGGGSGDPFQRLRLVLKSRQLAQRLDEKYNLSREIFADRWDSEKSAWKTPVKSELTFRKRLNAYLHQTQSPVTGAEALARAVGGMIKFDPVENTEYWVISVSHPDSDTALRRLNLVFAAADRLLREQDREKIKEKIRFLRTRTERAELDGLRSALFGALIGAEKNLYMLDSSQPYAAEVVEPAFVSVLTTSPNLSKTVVIPAIGAGFLGMVLVLMISIFIRE